MPLQMFTEKRTYRLAVAAGKGGVGKSTITAQLAFSFKKMGLQVGVIDADVYGPSMRRMLGEGEYPKENQGRLSPAISQGIPYISIAHFKQEGKAQSVRAPIANGILTQFIENVDFPSLDVLLVDFPPGTGDIQLTLAQKIAFDGALMIAAPQEVACMDVSSAIDQFDTLGIPLIGIIENFSFYELEGNKKTFPFGEGGGKRLAKRKNLPLVAQIPIECALSECSDCAFSIFEKGSPGLQNLFLHTAETILSILQNKKQTFISCVLKDGKTLLLKEPESEKALSSVQIQKNCPCALCHEKPPKVDHDVAIQHFSWTGRYGIKFQFTKGCSNGIYPISLLDSIHKDTLCL